MEDIEQVLTRGVEKIYPSKEFLKSKLENGQPLTIYYGIDPTGPTIHIGHLVPIRKLAQFQKLGHKIIFLIGDFTAMIGDPTDKTAARSKLSRGEVLENCKNYKEQISKIIDFTGENKAELKFNSEWFADMPMNQVLQLTSLFTVQQMLERDMFEKRMKEGKPIYIHEFLYPIMQGYDSIPLDVDGEIGGNDQTFNMLVGRDLAKSLNNKDKFVITTKLLVDPTGKKMGKTEGNMVALDQTAEDMFGKVMSWPDGMIVPAFEIVTDVSLQEIETIKQALNGDANPKEYKVQLAKEIVAMCKSREEADKAAEYFENTFSQGGIPEDIQTIEAKSDELLSEVLVAHKIIESKTDFKRLVEEGAVSNMDTDEKVSDFKHVALAGTYKIGKRRFVKVVS